MPYLGGVAIFLGWALGMVLASRFDGAAIGRTWAIIAAGLAIMLVGLFDDLRFMQPKVKLTANILVALFLVWTGLGNDIAGVLEGVGLMFSDEQRWLKLVYSVPVAVFIVVGACNATNLIDGLDGLCGGVLGIISLGFLILSSHMAISYPQDGDNAVRLALCLSMLGAALGFLPYNVNPAKIFMGDAGSMLLGLNAAILILLFFEARFMRFALGALMIFGLPIADMLMTLTRRWRNGRPIMKGDRSHFYDQLRDRGLTVRQVVAISYGLTLIFVTVGCLSIVLRGRYLVPLYLLFVVAGAATIAKMGLVQLEQPAPSRDVAAK
jgi:UDP-GlcNAc:undecaprenyl-phosphate GlcNAc-1-phosphate transferase